jgi:FkbM family methyltransferase
MGSPPPPQPYSLINGLQLRVPPVLAGIIPVSPNTQDFPYEVHSWLALEALIRPDSVVYDCGAAHGILSALVLSRWPAPPLRLHAFEANPAMREVARELLPGAELTWNPVCVGEASGGQVEFYCVPGPGAVASSRHDVVRRVHGQSVAVAVPLVALDDYARACAQWPDVVKLDIEGSEYAALLGATAILERRPHWVIETHPRQMVGAGASLSALCAKLEQEHGYPLFDLLGGALTTAAAFSERYAAAPGYLLASMRLAETPFVEALTARHREWEARYCQQADVLEKARQLVAAGEFAQAVSLLEPLCPRPDKAAEVSYLLAFSLQALGQGGQRPETLYGEALASGFAPFWVHYNLGAWLLGQGRIEEGRQHLLRARDLDPEHAGVVHYLSQTAV